MKGSSKLIIFLIILLILGVLALSVILSQPPVEDAEEPDVDDESVFEPPVEADTDGLEPYIVGVFNGTVDDVYLDGNMLYLTIRESNAELNRSWLYIYVYDLIDEVFIDKILVTEAQYAEIPIYRILDISDGKAYIYTWVGGGRSFIPLIDRFSISSGGEFEFKVVDLGGVGTPYTYRLNIGRGLGSEYGLLTTYEVLDGNRFILRVYDLDSGVLYVEFDRELYGIEGLTDLVNVYSSIKEGVLTAIFLGYEADYDIGRLRIYNVIIRFDILASELNIEVYPTRIYGAYGGIMGATAYVDDSYYYLFTAYELYGESGPVYIYDVESRSLLDGSLQWEYQGNFTPSEMNRSAYISSYVDDDIFYVSWIFIAGYSSGEELFNLPGWGAMYERRTLLIFVGMVYEGGGGFYKVGNKLYIPWIKYSSGSGIEDLILYNISQDGVEDVYNLYGSGYEGSKFVVFNSKLYLIGYELDSFGLVTRGVILRII
ncbi:MAG TPA: hypothetical protein EYH44_03865 [Thermoprotei archaeon]|nr:hypothetical protein [Thermoprotei archaeon]